MSNTQHMATRIIKKLLQIKKKNLFCTITVLERDILGIHFIYNVYLYVLFNQQLLYIQIK